MKPLKEMGELFSTMLEHACSESDGNGWSRIMLLILDLSMMMPYA